MPPSRRGPLPSSRNPPWAGEALAYAIGLVRAEGTRLRRRLRPLRAATKAAPDDPVTEEDVATERRVLRALSRRFPGHARLGEETGPAGPRSRYTWVLDPIDGTANFAAAFPLFCVSLALLDDGAPLLAAVYSSLDRQVCHALRGHGAWRGRTPLAVRDDRPPPLSLLGSNPSPRSGLAVDPRVEEFAKIRRLGSAVLHLLAVASGWFLACVEERARVWDLAAATLLVREAGGIVLGADGRPLDAFRLGPGAAPAIPCVAGAPGPARRLLPILRRGPWRPQRARTRASAAPPPKRTTPARTRPAQRVRSARRRAR